MRDSSLLALLARCGRQRGYPSVNMMRFAHEIRSPKDLDLPKEGDGWTMKERVAVRTLFVGIHRRPLFG